MELSEFQKKILDKIENNEVYDIYSFIEKFLDTSISSFYWGNTRGFISYNIIPERRDEIDYGKAIIFDMERLKEVCEKITSYIVLYYSLLENKLIADVHIKTRKFVPLLVKTNTSTIIVDFEPPLNKINKSILDCFLNEILITPELIAFKKRGYLTLTEFEMKEQNKDRKKSLFWTKVTAFTAIVLSLSSIILQVIFSGKERDVKIVNENSFPVYQKILLVDSSKPKKVDIFSPGDTNSNK